jgi:phage gpG-like protein
MPITEKRTIPKGKELERAIAEAKKRSLQTIGIIMEEGVKKRFEDQGPDWKPLKPATIKAKKSSSILIDTGLLVNMIESKIDEQAGQSLIGVFGKERALIALVHERGSVVRNIPARPFLIPTQLEKTDECLEIIRSSYKVLFEGL